MEIQVYVNKQKLKIATNLKTFVVGTQEFVKFAFHFVDESWEELTVFAQFRQGDTGYNQFLDADSSVYLPSEITVGECWLTLHGVKDTIIAITESVRLTIEDNKLVEDGESTKLSTSLYSQLVTKIGSDDLQTESQTIIGAINEIAGQTGGLPFDLITIADIDEICGADIAMASEVAF